MSTLKKVLTFIKEPSAVLSSMLLLFMAFSAYGWGFKLPKTMVEERIDDHFEETHLIQAEQHAQILADQASAESEREALKRDVEFLVRLECQRTDMSVLEAAGMISRCRELGVSR